MNDLEKPSLGVKPAYVHSKQRIKELADAISRTCADEGITPEVLMKLWANEIILQLDLLNQIRIMEEVD